MTKFQQTRLQKLKYQQRLEIDPSFINVFDSTKNLTKDFYDEVNDKLHGLMKNHIVMYVHGETGTLKSSVAQEIALKNQPDFSAKNIVFDNQSLLNLAAQSKPGDFLIRDESPFEFGIGSYRAQKQIQILAETLRQRQNSLIFISPTERPVMTAHYILHTIDTTEDKQNVRVGIIDPATLKYMGFILVKIHYDSPIWKEYQIKKNIFLEQVIKMDFGESNTEEDAKKLLASTKLKSCQNRKELVILAKEIFKVSRTGMEIDYLVTKALQMLRENGITLKDLEKEKND